MAKKRVLLIIALPLLLSACMGPNINIKEDIVYDQPIEALQEEYLLGPSDVISIAYHTAPSLNKGDYIIAPDDVIKVDFFSSPNTTLYEYTLSVGDRIKVEFYNHPNINRELTIRSDGKITLPIKGDFAVAGLTPAELNDRILQSFSDIFKDPMPTVSVLESNAMFESLESELKERSLSVRPDGKITLPIKGEVVAAGLTPLELSKKITRLYSDIFKNPLNTVTLLEYNVAVKELKTELATDNFGRNKLVTIRPDGYATFPLIGSKLIAGLSVSQVKDILEREYKKINGNISLSVFLEEMNSNVVYVMGEVKKPQMVLMESPTTVTQVVAKAEGFSDAANLNTVLIISRNKNGNPVGRLIDLERVIEAGNIGQDILLRQYDVVYIPKSTIAKADLFVEQFINGLIPKAFKFGVNYGYISRVDNLY